MTAEKSPIEAERTDALLAEFFAGLDAIERAFILHTFAMMKKAKTKAVANRRWLEFERWHSDRHGIPHRRPKRVRKSVSKTQAEICS